MGEMITAKDINDEGKIMKKFGNDEGESENSSSEEEGED